MAASRLAQILEREYQSKGLVSGLGSAMGKRVKEKMDIRNALFGGSSLSAAMGRKVFGKGYSATSSATRGSSTTDISAKLGSQSEELSVISEATKVTAKNTLALPSMARDMFLVKENIIRLVKLNKGTPRTKAGDWFSRQQARESSLSFNKTPTKTSETPSEKPSSSGGFLGLLGSLFSAFTPSSLLGVVTGVVALGVTFAGLKTAIEKVSELAIKLYNWVANTEIGRSLGMKPTEDPGSKGGTGGSGGSEGGRSLKNPFDVQWGNVWDKTKDVGSNAAAAGGEYLGYRVAKSTLPKNNIKLSSGKTFIQDGKYISSAKLAGEGKLGKMVEALRKFAVEAAKKGWGPRIISKITGKLGAAVAAKLAVFLASLASAGWTAGISLALTVISFGLMLKDIYDIYDAIMGPGGIWEELTEEDKVSPSPKPASANDKEISENNDKLAKLREELKTETRPIAKANIESQIKLYERKNKELQDAAPKNSPEAKNGKSPTPLSGVNQEMTFNQMSREQQDAFLNNQARAEGSDKPGSVGHRHNNPGNIVAKSPTEVYPAQAKFGGVPGETIKGSDGKTRTFVRFPTWQDGLNAQRDLWTRKYGDVSLGKALHSWVDPSSMTEMAQYQTAVFNGAGTPPANTPSVDGKPSSSGTSLASMTIDPFKEMMGMMGNMINSYHEQTKAQSEGKPYDSGSLEAYNDEFLKKLLESQGFGPNKA